MTIRNVNPDLCHSGLAIIFAEDVDDIRVKDKVTRELNVFAMTLPSNDIVVLAAWNELCPAYNNFHPGGLPP
jgi:hypothetical protein